jgi:hypothetical protein
MMAAVRRAVAFTQAEIARALRAAKKAGAAEVELRIGEQSKIIFRLLPSTEPPPLECSEQIITLTRRGRVLINPAL